MHASVGIDPDSEHSLSCGSAFVRRPFARALRHAEQHEFAKTRVRAAQWSGRPPRRAASPVRPSPAKGPGAPCSTSPRRPDVFGLSRRWLRARALCNEDFGGSVTLGGEWQPASDRVNDFGCRLRARSVKPS